MKKIIIVLLAFSLKACAPATIITGSWKNRSYTSKSYENILVAVLNNHAVEKAAVENDLAEQLGKYSVKASKSMDLFPPDVSNSDSDRVTIMRKVHGKDIDAILTVSVLKKQTESRYVQRRYPYNPAGSYNYYNDFWGYYSYWYPYAYSPAYYTERNYYMETNLYDAKTEKLVWSAQSETYDVANLAAFSKDYTKAIIDKLVEDGILKAEAPKS